MTKGRSIILKVYLSYLLLANGMDAYAFIFHTNGISKQLHTEDILGIYIFASLSLMCFVSVVGVFFWNKFALGGFVLCCLLQTVDAFYLGFDWHMVAGQFYPLIILAVILGENAKKFSLREQSG